MLLGWGSEWVCLSPSTPRLIYGRSSDVTGTWCLVAGVCSTRAGMRSDATSLISYTLYFDEKSYINFEKYLISFEILRLTLRMNQKFELKKDFVLRTSKDSEGTSYFGSFLPAWERVWIVGSHNARRNVRAMCAARALLMPPASNLQESHPFLLIKQIFSFKPRNVFFNLTNLF